MTVLATASTDPTTVLLWCGATAVLLFAAAGGFFAGVISAPWLQEWAVRRASAEIHRMYDRVIAEVERAHRLCAQLAEVGGGLSPEEWQRIERVQEEFQATCSRIAQSCGADTDAKDKESSKQKPQDFVVDWVRTPIEPVSGTPDKTAFEQNLKSMLTRGVETNLESGLLLIRMDKADQLRRRLGNDAVEKLLSRLTSVVLRAARDQDLLCRLSADTLGLLCPSLPPLLGSKIADRIREAVRSYRFRSDDSGPEVLVTASFGYANCTPGDPADVVRDRASDGMARSQSLGRNQLHVHDGRIRALCRA